MSCHRNAISPTQLSPGAILQYKHMLRKSHNKADRNALQYLRYKTKLAGAKYHKLLINNELGIFLVLQPIAQGPSARRVMVRKMSRHNGPAETHITHITLCLTHALQLSEKTAEVLSSRDRSCKLGGAEDHVIIVLP